MKNRLSYLFILLLIGVSCQQEPVDQIMDGCVGITFYYLDNQSSHALSVEFVGARLDRQLDSAAVIPTQQRVLIGQDASFGSNPHPADTFSSIAISTLVDGKKTIVYTQVPIQTALWTKQKRNPTDPDFGCQEVSYSLTITDDLLK